MPRLNKYTRQATLAIIENSPVGWAELHFYIEDVVDPITGEELGPGIIKLADHQRRVLRAALERDGDGRFKWNTIVYSCPKKSGKCAWASDRVMLADGSWHQFHDLVGEQFQVVAFDEERLRYTVADGVAEDNGLEDCWRITTKYGRVLTRTSEHKFYTLGGWRAMDDLEPGDRIGVPLSLDVEGQDWLSDTEAKLLAYLISEGYIREHGITFSQTAGEVLEEFRALCASIGVDTWQRDDGRCDWYLRGERHSYNRALDLVRQVGLAGKRSRHKFIPNDIMTATDRQIVEFLRRLYAGDGGTEVKKAVAYYSTSRQLAEDVAHLLMRFGIHAIIRDKECPACRSGHSYSVILQDAESVQKFADSIGFFGSKAVGLERVLARANEKYYDRARDVDVLPRGTWDYITRRCQEQGRTLQSLGIGYFDKSHAPKRERVLKAALVLEDESLAQLCRAPIGWDRIKTIEYAGELPTVAVCIPGLNTYVGDTIEHNTRIAALVACWMASQYGPYAEVYCAANDGKQSEDRIVRAVKRCVDLNSNLDWHSSVGKVELPDGSFIEAIPVDPSGEAGANPTFVCFSEMWGYRLQHKQRLWTEMTISPVRHGRSIRWVDSYAGFVGESPVLEMLYDQAVNEGRRYEEKFPDLPVWVNEEAKLFCYWDHEARMSWQDHSYYSAEERLLTPPEFRRIHRNEWVTSEDTFIPVEWWDACQEELPPMRERQYVVLGVDAAVSSDCFGLIAVTRHPDRYDDVAVRYVQKWTPPKGGQIDFMADDGPEATIEKLCDQWNVVEVAYDPYQLHRTATEQYVHKRHAFWKPFGQAGKRLEADSQLFQLIRDRRVAHSGNPDLRQHLMNCNAKTSKQEDTKLRLVKRRPQDKIDLAVALSMATSRALALQLPKGR